MESSFSLEYSSCLFVLLIDCSFGSLGQLNFVIVLPVCWIVCSYKDFVCGLTG